MTAPINNFRTSQDKQQLKDDCFFNLPVLYVKQKTLFSPTDSMPCYILKSTKGDPPEVGVNPLPKSLADVVNDRFCQTTYRRNNCHPKCDGCESVPPNKNLTVVTPTV